MGYKLAGFDVVGGVDIDERMVEIYRANHYPRHSYCMGVSDLRRKFMHSGIPDELRDLDILDGSPPCSSFSSIGTREETWGKQKKFREGQARQVLDDLFFDFIDLASIMRPRVIVAENVKGMLLGKARGYVKQIFRRFAEAGYSCQLFLANASRMGVPQERERVFFIANRLRRRMVLSFDEPQIGVSSAWADLDPDERGSPLSAKSSKFWAMTPMGSKFSNSGKPNVIKNKQRIHPDRPTYTQTAGDSLTHWQSPNNLSRLQAVRVQTFPDDYNFMRQHPIYVCGMSVPPRMMQRVAEQVRDQLLQAGRAEDPVDRGVADLGDAIMFPHADDAPALAP